MASTATTRLRLEKQALGENNATWGAPKLNDVFDRLDEAIGGVAAITISGSTTTLSSANYSTDEARKAVLVLSGTLGANSNVVVPNAEKLYLCVNNCVMGSYTLTIKTAAGVGVSLATGPQWVYCNATSVFTGTPRVDQLGTASAALNMGGYKVTNSATPTAGSDLATKSYVDGVVVAGDNSAALAALQASVDSAVATLAPKASPSFTSGATVSTGVMTVPLGTVTSPGYTFSGDTNTGIYSAGADSLSLVAGGTSRLAAGTAGVAVAGTFGTTGAATFSSTLGVTGAVTLSSTLAAGASTLSSLGVTGAATVGSTLGVSGAATLASLAVTGAATVGSTLGVSGASTLASAAITGAATVGSTLGVSGAATLASAAISGAATVGSTLAVTGATTLSSTLAAGASTLASASITGAATVGSTLAVTGSATFSGTLSATGAIAAVGGMTASAPVLTAAGTVGAPSHSFSGDPNTGIRNSATDTLAIVTGGADRFSVDSTGIVRATNDMYWETGTNRNIGYSSLVDHAAGNVGVTTFGVEDGGGWAGLVVTNSRVGAVNSQSIDFKTAEGGISTATTRMAITKDGYIEVGQTSTLTPGFSGNTTQGSAIYPDGRHFISQPAFSNWNQNADGVLISINRSGVAVGSIAVTTTATAFNTSSDYRLKTDIEPLTGGLERLAGLKPKRFRFKSDPRSLFDGFLAHEVSPICAEAVTGAKDGEQMQGLDLSKLVPVLVAAVQELAARVEALEGNA